jgi:hypothetical protein
MRRSQPIDINSPTAKRLGLTEESSKVSDSGKEIVKIETVDCMFDFGSRKLSFSARLMRPFRRAATRFGDYKRGIKRYFRWRESLEQYYPWDTNSFLPLLVRHLEEYTAIEMKYGMTTPEFKEYKISTAQEAIEILKRIIADDYIEVHRKPVDEKWGEFPYEKTTYTSGSVGFKHLTPDGYDEEIHAAYEQADAYEQVDLKRLGELIEQNMMDWWD